jgi:hypothetical protein
MFLLSPTPVAFASASTSRTSAGTSVAAEKMRCPLPPPPPIAFRRKRRPGFSASRRSDSAWMVAASSSMEKRSTRAAYDASRSASASCPAGSAVSPSAGVSRPCDCAQRASAARSGNLRSSVRTVASFTPGVTETLFAMAVRFASSFAPAAACVYEPGPMNRRPASSRLRTKCASSAMKP